MDGDFVRFFFGRTLCLSHAGSGGVVYLSGGFSGSLAGPETRGFFEGVDWAARPSQRPGLFEGGVVVGVGTGGAEAGFGR